MLGIMEAEISSKSRLDSERDDDYVDQLPGSAVYMLVFDSNRVLKQERVHAWLGVMQYRASRPGQKVLLAATHLDELPVKKEVREMVLLKLSRLIERLVKQWVINYADLINVNDDEVCQCERARFD
jgi:hypothetical protein